MILIAVTRLSKAPRNSAGLLLYSYKFCKLTTINYKLIFMLNLKLIAVGKLKEKAFIELEKEYLKRLKPFAKISVIEIPDQPHTNETDASIARQKEAEKILKQIKTDSYTIAFDEAGKSLTTQHFAVLLKPFNESGHEVNLIIGGSTGLDESIKKRADIILSLSPLTFTHNFARVILAEQLYRVVTILNGKKYHY